MKQPIGWLITGQLILWFVLAYFGRFIIGTQAVTQSAAAMLFCLFPAVVTFALCRRAFSASPDQQLLAFLGSMGIRLLVVLGLGALAYSYVPDFQDSAFWIWLIVFYLSTLALEISLLISDQRSVVSNQRATSD